MEAHMARFLDRRRHNPANPPVVLGLDLEDVGWGTGGLFATGLGNDKVVAPILRNIVPGVYANEMMGKVIDAGTTFATAYLLGELAARAKERGGRMVQVGGSFLAGARFLAAFIPGFQLSAEVPKSLNFNFFGGGGAPAPLPAGADNAALPAAGRTTGAGDNGGAAAVYTQSISPMAPASQAYSLKGGM